MTNDHDSSGVVLSRIYTRTGDDGTTMLGDRSRTAKTDSRLVAYADCEEANAAIGLVLALGSDLPEDVVNVLAGVQNDLFDVGGDLCAPMRSDEKRALRIGDAYIDDLEEACDRYNEGLPVLRSFLLPGGTAPAALLHQARTVVRRTERSVWVALEEYGDSVVNPATARYLNRLSDLLFIIGRVANADRGDTLWQPGLRTRPHGAAEGSGGESS